MFSIHRCGKCKEESKVSYYYQEDVKFYQSLCKSCSNVVWAQLTYGDQTSNQFGYKQRYGNGTLITAGGSCSSVRPDFSKEKGNIKKGEIEEEVF